MPDQTRNVRLGPRTRTVLGDSGELLTAPDNWALLPPGDAGLTRRVKAAGPSWTVSEKRGRRTFSRGVWAPAAAIEAARQALRLAREDPAYTRKLDAARRRREAVQDVYVGSFVDAIVEYLGFASQHETLALRLAKLVAEHATPVGSGTVARTKRIPIDQRARAAVIAWMRHKTTGYDRQYIENRRGRRREVRREHARESVKILRRYRDGVPPTPDCPLQAAVSEDTESAVAVATRPVAKAPSLTQAEPNPRSAEDVVQKVAPASRPGVARLPTGRRWKPKTTAS